MGMFLTAVFSDTRHTASLYAREVWRRFHRRVAVGRVNALRFAGSTPDRLIAAPIDLRMADNHIADEIYAGRFPLAGRVFDTMGESPFTSDLPSRQFAQRLHSFRWLRHLRAANNELAFANARALTDDWITLHGRSMRGPAWEPDIIAQRVMAWFSHSPIVMRGADHAFYRRFLKSLALQVRYLRLIAPTCGDGEERFRVRMALAMASLAMPASPIFIRSAARHLDHEISRQILPDGGHVSRNPQVLLDLLADLLPLRQTYINLGHPPPSQLIPGIDRMFPALRFFRHANGDLALFNGASANSGERLICVLRYDESTGTSFRSLPHLHYQRLQAGSTVVIADTGAPPPGPLSKSAHAGCLAFELSSGSNRIVVNAGAPLWENRKLKYLSRSTAAHSTVTLNDTSSSRQSRSRFLGPVLLAGVQKITLERLDADGGQGFMASHDGYLTRFGLLHQRVVRLSAAGDVINGSDRMMLPDGDNPAADDDSVAVARFHLHPQISVVRAGHR
jgi:uncharacterized heparinase superfamily protein